MTRSKTRFCVRSSQESGARVSCRLAIGPCRAMRMCSKRSRMRSGLRWISTGMLRNWIDARRPLSGTLRQRSLDFPGRASGRPGLRGSRSCYVFRPGPPGSAGAPRAVMGSPWPFGAANEGSGPATQLLTVDSGGGNRTVDLASYFRARVEPSGLCPRARKVDVRLAALPGAFLQTGPQQLGKGVAPSPAVAAVS